MLSVFCILETVSLDMFGRTIYNDGDDVDDDDVAGRWLEMLGWV